MKSLHVMELELENEKLRNEIKELKQRIANRDKFFRQLEESIYTKAKFLFFGKEEG